MSQSLNVQEMAIAISVERNDPTILTPDFLKHTGIVKGDWELAREPLRTASVAQVTFKNGVNIVSQLNRIVFSEVIATKEIQDTEVSAIANNYIQKLPQAKYQGIGINFGGYVLFPQSADAANNFIFKTLLQPGPWSEFGNAPVQAALKFSYTLEGKQLNLEVNQAAIRFPDQKLIPSVLFSGNFNYLLPQNPENNQISNFIQIIENWQQDLELYRDVVNTRFINTGNGVENYQIKTAPDDSLVFPN